MPTFVTPISGTAQLTTRTGLTVISQGRWLFSQSGYNDGATWGVSLGGPVQAAPKAPTATVASGLLYLQAQGWTIEGAGNTLTAFTDPSTGQTYGPDRCRILVTGAWSVPRRPNSNSFNSTGVIYNGLTETDEGERSMTPYLLNYQTYNPVQYVIQGSAVSGGAQDTFTPHVFYCKCTESATTDNSNREFQSNSTATPIWAYTYSKSWQTD
jgi:hypothetical protein